MLLSQNFRWCALTATLLTGTSVLSFICCLHAFYDRHSLNFHLESIFCLTQAGCIWRKDVQKTDSCAFRYEIRGEIIVAKLRKHQFSNPCTNPEFFSSCLVPLIRSCWTCLSCWGQLPWVPTVILPYDSFHGLRNCIFLYPCFYFPHWFYRKTVTLIWIKMEMLLIAPCGVRQFGHLKWLLSFNLTCSEGNLCVHVSVFACFLCPMKGSFFKPCSVYRVFCLCSLPVCCFCPYCCNWFVNFHLLQLRCKSITWDLSAHTCCACVLCAHGPCRDVRLLKQRTETTSPQVTWTCQYERKFSALAPLPLNCRRHFSVYRACSSSHTLLMLSCAAALC